jgi:RND family efflux transporter MFP subunit
MGLWTAPSRTAGGYRLYGNEHLKRLNFIRRARRLGFSIGEVRTLLRVADERKRPCAEVRVVAEAHLADVRHKIAVAAAITVPGTVTSNAYRDTKVNSLVGGVVRQVHPELGAAVRRGDPLAVIFSNELAEAQMRYLSMQAMLAADHQKLERTRKLTEIGAASRQELEEVTAVHQSHATELAAYRQRLLLYGLGPTQVAAVTDASHVVSEVAVTAPLNGVVVSRTINPGQVVTVGQELFVVTDLSTVWVIGDLYEKDFASVRHGSPATVTFPTSGQRALRGRAAYIDPRVDPGTRTAKVRVEVSNPDGALRLGMFVQVTFEGVGGERRMLVPRSAVQTIGERAVVYVRGDDEGASSSAR